MKRYGVCGESMQEIPGGEYVLHTDASAIEASHQKLINALECAIQYIPHRDLANSLSAVLMNAEDIACSGADSHD